MKLGLVYYSNGTDGVGIDNKMDAFFSAGIKLNIKTTSFKLYSNGLINEFMQLLTIVKAQEDVFLIRYNNSKNFILFLAIIYFKFNRKKVILDVPTPIISFLKELRIISSGSLSLKALIIILSTYLLGPLPFIFSDLVVQYAEESSFFNPKVVKQILLGNGIDSQNIINLLNKNKKTEKSSIGIELINHNHLNLVSIGNNAPWHGWDKLIRLIPEINLSRKTPINFFIIGDGPGIEALKVDVKKRGLENTVHFLGRQNRENYVSFISQCDLGVSTLSWEVVGVRVASPLKSREYICCGIPVVFTAYDKDLSNTNYGYEISCDDKSIFDFFTRLEKIYLNKNKEQYFQFANESLDMKKKLQFILEKINYNL
jgi:glycosyltransferase involved in cell wall biosynthesis